MKTYKLPIEKIPEVKGEFKTLYDDGEFVYIEPIEDIELIEPFIQEELPKKYQEKIEENLAFYRVQKTIALNAHCDFLLKNFTSNALGEDYIYDGKQEDQINLMGLVIAGIDGYFRCAKATEPTHKQNYPHTKEQIKKVYSDGLAFKAEMIYICGVLKEYLKTLSDEKAIKSLKWEDYEKIKKA